MQYLYAQLGADGVCVGISQNHAEMQPSAHLVSIATYDATLLGKRYDAANGTWHNLAPQTQAGRRVSVLGFRRRFTRAERGAIEWASVDRADQPEAQRRHAAELRATLADQAAATYIDLDDPETIAGVQTLEAIGLLNAGRAMEIIGAPVQPEERP